MMIYKLTDKISTIIEDNKTVKASIKKEEVGRFLNFVDNVNALGRKECRLSNGRTLNEYKFPDVFKDLIFPDAITLAGGVKYFDYLSRPVLTETKLDPTKVVDPTVVNQDLMTPFELESFSTRLYGMFRKASVEVELSKLKVEVTIKDVDISRYYLDENSKDSVCPAMDDNIYPIPLIIQVTNTNYCYVGVEEQILRFMSLKFTNFRA